MEHYNVIIVGAGSAGVPLATRLSEDSNRTVLLIDAGPHFKSMDQFPKELQHGGYLSQMNPNHPNNWGFAADLTTDGARQIVPRGMVVGGSSALNGTLFERGTPEDFNEWEAAGNDQWSWEKVLPYFKKLEKDLDYTNEWHGTDGPIPVTRPKPSDWVPANHAFVEACLAAGFPMDEDKNDPESYGVGPLPTNNINGFRMNTAHTYLEPVMNERSNLTIKGDCFVRRVIFEGRRAIGVEAEFNGEVIFINGDEIVLSSSAVKSPHILMLSGVGPADQLNKMGIPIVYDNPNVGQNFSDHASAGGVTYRIDKRTGIDPDELSGLLVGLHFTAEGSPFKNDMLSLASANSMGRQMTSGVSLVNQAILGLTLMKEMSVKKVLEQYRLGRELSLGVLLMKGMSRGEMNLVSDDPHVRPHLQYHYLEDPLDIQRIRTSIRLMNELVESPAFRKLGAKRLSPGNEDLSTDESLDKYIRSHVGTAIHMASTCKMGPDSDETAVVDQYCRVRGVEGLRVVDTSIWPEVVRRCTNATAVMTGERAADFFD